MDLFAKLRAVKAVGLSQAWMAVANSFYKERLDRRFRTPRPVQTSPIQPGQLRQAESLPVFERTICR